MKLLKLANLAGVAISLSMAVAGLPAKAADFPNAPIKIVVAYPAGGATDVIARVIGQRLSERVKQPVVIENRPGASGMIGSDATARAPADGYTIIYTAADTHSINPHVYSSISYDARKDFSPIAMTGENPFALVVSPKLEAKTVAEFIELAKKKDGALTFSSWGVGSSGHAAGEMFAAATGIKMRHIPFQGAAPAITAVMSGEVDAMLVPRTLAEPNHKSGKVRMLATATKERSKSAPDVPTLTEAGVALTIAPWQGFLGPANIPQDVVTFLNKEINASIADAATQESLLTSGLVVSTGTPDDFKKLLEAEWDRWGKVIRDANIKAN